MLGAGDGHVEKPPLLLDVLLAFFYAACMGDDAVLSPGDEHHGKFQALGGVDGHQVHLALQCVVLHVVP